MTEQITVEEIRRLRLEPGDHLLVRVPHDTTHATVTVMRKYFAELWPSVPVMVVAADIDISVVNQPGPSS